MKSTEFINEGQEIVAPEWYALALKKILAYWQRIADTYDKPFKINNNPDKDTFPSGSVNIGDVVIKYDTGVKYKFGAYAYFRIQIMNDEYGYDGAIDKMDLQPDTFEYEIRYLALGAVYREILEPNTSSNWSKDETQNRYGILGHTGGPSAIVFERVEPVYYNNAQDAGERASKSKRDPSADFAVLRQDPTNSVQKDSGNYK